MKTKDLADATTGTDSKTSVHICQSNGVCCTTEEKSALEKDTVYTFDLGAATTNPCTNFEVALGKTHIELEHHGLEPVLVQSIIVTATAFEIECYNIEIQNKRVMIAGDNVIYI